MRERGWALSGRKLQEEQSEGVCRGEVLCPQHPVFWMVPGHWCSTAPQGRGHLQTLLGPCDGHLSVFSQLRSPCSSPLHLPGHGSLPLPRPRQPLSPSLRGPSSCWVEPASSRALQSKRLLPLSSQPAGGWGFYWGNICLPSPVWLLFSSITCEVESHIPLYEIPRLISLFWLDPTWANHRRSGQILLKTKALQF